MIVVADSSPLHYLILIEQVGLLRRLYSEVVVPEAGVLSSPLIDESDGRREASRRRILVTGTLGVLRTAAEKGFIDVPDVLGRLQATTFYVDEDLIAKDFGRWLRA